MEKVKDPAMMLGVANSVGLVGSIYYFYKEIQAIRADQVKIARNVEKLIKSVGELEKNEQGRLETIKSVSTQVREMDKAINMLPSNDDLEQMGEEIEAVVQALNQSEIKLDLPHMGRKPDKRSRRDDEKRVRHGRSRTTPRRSTYQSNSDDDVDDLISQARSSRT